jgi:glycosyltransferase involved in cell wall biosynthesis
MTDQPRVLHVLPHPGGGGEHYVDVLSTSGSYRSTQVFLSTSATPRSLTAVAAIVANIRATRHDLVHVHGEVAGGLSLPALAAKPSILTLHGLHLVQRLEGSRQKLAVRNLKMIISAASRTVCVSEAERELVKHYAMPKGKLVLIPNGVPAPDPGSTQQRAAARSALGLDANDAAALFLASLDDHKEPLLAIRAALAAAPGRLVLIVAGDGPLRGEAERLADGDARVRIVGHRADVRQLLAGADFLVLPSRREGLSYAVLEAMAAGLPVVASDIPPNVEAIGDGGILVASGRVTGFTEAFEQLANDPDRRTALGERARSRVMSRFSEASMVRSTLNLYASVLSEHR